MPDIGLEKDPTATARPKPRRKTRLYIIAGASNAAGGGDIQDLQPPLDGQIPRAKYWNWENWVPLEPGFGIGEADNGDRHGLELSLGLELSNQRRGNLRFFKGTAGGRTLANEWHPVTGPLYPRLLTMVRLGAAELSPRGPIQVEGFFWMQGESDAQDAAAAAAYEDNLRLLIDRVRADFLNPELKVILGRISDILPLAAFPHQQLVRQAVENVAAGDPFVRFADTDGLSHNGDRIHFDSAALVRLGERMAQAFLGEAEASAATG